MKYKIEDIIFGLRSLYVANALELSKLKEYVTVADNKISDFSFLLSSQDLGQDPNVLCSFKVKQTALKKSALEFLSKIGIEKFAVDPTIVVVPHEKAEQFILENQGLVVKPEEFYSQLNTILTSEFAKKIQSEIIFLENENRLNIGHDGIWYYLGNLCMLNYNSEEDSLKLYQPFGSNLVLPAVLKSAVLRGTLPAYHLDHIDAYLTQAKKIIIEGSLTPAKAINYQIFEDNENIVLKRTRK